MDSVKSVDLVKAEASKLIALELYDSAEALLSFYISSISNSPNMESIYPYTAVLYELLADIAFTKKEYRRALSALRQAFHQQQRIVTQQFKNYRSPTMIANSDQARLRYKECKCLVEMNDHVTALREIEAIPVKFRDVKMNMLFGFLYKHTSPHEQGKRKAILAYKEALRSAPMSIEIIEALVNVGVDAIEITTVMDDTFRTNIASELAASGGWMHSLVQALVHKRNFEHEKSNAHWQNLSLLYPKNNYILMNMAQVAFEQDQIDAAVVLYRQLRRFDSTVIKGTDIMGRILHKAEDATELSKLANEALDCQPQRPEGWLTAALFCDLKGDTEKAFTLIDKATQLEPKFGNSFKIRGQLLHAQGNFDQAYIAFSQANSLDKDMISYAGMITASIALGKLKDAVNVSRESICSMPRSASAYLLLANVIANSPQGAMESVRAYSKALKLSPLNKLAVQGMAQVYIDEEKFEEAAACITEALRKISCHKLQLLLAKAQAGSGLYNEAIENLHISISMHPKDSSEALREFERIEGLLRAENLEDDDVFEEDGEEENDEDDILLDGEDSEEGEYEELEEDE